MECPTDSGGKWKSIHAHVFIHSVSLYFLVGAFNSFTFKVIINLYDPVTVFLIVLGLFSVGLFHLLCFLPREVPSAFVCKAGLVVLNSLNFCLSGNFLIYPSNLKESCWVEYSWMLSSSLSSL